MSAEKVTINLEVFSRVKDYILSEDAKADLNFLLCCAIDSRNPKTALAETLIVLGADPNAKVFGEYPIEIACRRGSAETVKMLLEWGAKVNAGCLSYAINHMYKDVEKIVRENL